MFGIAMVGLISMRPVPTLIKSKLNTFPMKISNFVGNNLYLPDFVIDILKPDSYVYRIYSDNKGHNFVLFIAYFGTAKGGRTGHNPYACLLGSGWNLINISKVKITPPGYNKPVKINFILSKKGLTYLISMYWYQVKKNQVISTGLDLNIYRFKNMLLHGRCAGIYVLIFSPTPKKDISKTEELTKRFAGIIISKLPNYWPIEIEE